MTTRKERHQQAMDKRQRQMAREESQVPEFMKLGQTKRVMDRRALKKTFRRKAF